MSICSSAFMPAWAHSTSFYSTVLLFCYSKASVEEEEGGVGKISFVFSINLAVYKSWFFTGGKKKKSYLQNSWSFQRKRERSLCFNCFPFILNEQWLVRWNSRHSVRIVQKVRQTSNKGHMKALCFFFFFFFRFLLCLRLAKECRNPNTSLS